jgi:OOP family OmpA-OmpF porin
MGIACKQCGAPLAEGEAFCTKCGARRSESTAGTPAQQFCTKCGAALEAGIKFCTKCGAPVGTTPTAAPAAEVGRQERARASQPAAPPVKTPTPAPTTSPASAPAATSGSPTFKFVAVVIVLVVLLGVVGVGAFIYVASRAKAKVTQIEQAYGKPPAADAAHTGTAGNAGPSGAASASKSKQAAPYGWTLVNGKLVPAPPPSAPSATPAPPPPAVPVAATGDIAKDWALEYERTPNGPDADLVVRTGDINNLGFGWPKGFDPFSGKSTPPHPWPDINKIPPAAPAGTDRIMIGSAVIPGFGDGYSGALSDCLIEKQLPSGSAGIPRLEAGCKQERQLTMPQPIVMHLGALPPKINEVLFQIFADDFQPVPLHSHFQVSLNGTRIPSFEYAINALDQSGPIGKLLTLRLLPEYWPLLQSGTVNLLIDDPTTHVPDGYAVDFVRILVNSHNFKYQVSITASVVDADKHTPIAGATVTAALESAATDRAGKCALKGIPAGLVIATASAPGYDENSVSVDLVAGQSGQVQIQLHRHQESTEALEKAIAETGSATIYGIHFDTDSAKLRPDSLPALNAVLGLINHKPGSRWLIEGHTDNQGSADHNQKLSEQRADSVVAWLKAHGVSADRLVPQGFGASRPVADNATANGRALNRRVEVALAGK